MIGTWKRWNRTTNEKYTTRRAGKKKERKIRRTTNPKKERK
jgi:hypothetical protein